MLSPWYQMAPRTPKPVKGAIIPLKSAPGDVTPVPGAESRAGRSGGCGSPFASRPRRMRHSPASAIGGSVDSLHESFIAAASPQNPPSPCMSSTSTASVASPDFTSGAGTRYLRGDVQSAIVLAIARPFQNATSASSIGPSSSVSSLPAQASGMVTCRRNHAVPSNPRSSASALHADGSETARQPSTSVAVAGSAHLPVIPGSSAFTEVHHCVPAAWNTRRRAS